MPKTFDKATTARSATAARVAEQVRNGSTPAAPATSARPRAVAAAGGSGALERVAMNLPVEVIRAVDRALYDIRQSTGRKVSTSGFLEVALRELLDRPDVEEILAKHGATARRATPKAS